MSQTLFTVDTPTSTNVVDGTDAHTLGTVIIPAKNGVVSAIRWFFPTSLPGTVTAALYRWDTDTTGTLLSSISTFSAPVAGTWNTVNLAAGVAVTAGQKYVAVVYSPLNYVAYAQFFQPGAGKPGSSGLTNLNLTGPADDTVTPVHNGKFHVFAGGGGSMSYPDQSFNGGCYFVDVVYTSTVIVPVGQASETDSTASVKVVKISRPGQAQETDLARAAAAKKTYHVEQATEINMALAVSTGTNAPCPGSAALSPCDLKGVIDTVVSSFADTCLVQSMDWDTPNGYGGTTVTIATTTVVPCRVQARIGDLARDAYASGLMTQEFNVYLPPSTSIRERDRVVYKGHTLQVRGFNAPQTEQTFIEALCTEVR